MQMSWRFRSKCLVHDLRPTCLICSLLGRRRKKRERLMLFPPSSSCRLACCLSSGRIVGEELSASGRRVCGSRECVCCWMQSADGECRGYSTCVTIGLRALRAVWTSVFYLVVVWQGFLGRAPPFWRERERRLPTSFLCSVVSQL
ncbi:unnamed protein product [Ectocarpus sp. 8 AP-2014]